MQNRREFIKVAGAGALSMMTNWASAETTSDKWGTLLPQRKLTRDGTKVTAFSLGGFHLGLTEGPNEAQSILERSMELGVRFYDNARKYHRGRSEEYMGKFLCPKYRDQIYLMTKAEKTTGQEVRQQLNESLNNLNTDYIDLWQVHALVSPEDVDNRIEAGVLDAFLEAKSSGKVRAIGFTGHSNPETHLHFLKRLDELGIEEFEVCQMPLNVCDATYESFQQRVLPVLLKKDYGVIAMKTMAGGGMMGNRHGRTPPRSGSDSMPNVLGRTSLSAANLHQYVYSLPVSSLCSGCRSVRELEANIQVLNNLKSMTDSDRKTFEAIAKPYAGVSVEFYKRVLDNS